MITTYSRPTEELRQVACGSVLLQLNDKAYRVQRKWQVWDNAPANGVFGLMDGKLNGELPRDEWRDLPIVTEADVRAEKQAKA